MGADEAIKDAFCTLLEKENYDQITIAEICRAAHVSSKTFYKYFDGKPGLVRALMYDDWVAPVLQVREVLPLDSIRSSTHLMIEQSFERIWTKRAIYKNLFKYYGRTPLADDVTAVLSDLNREIYAHYGFSEEEYEFVVQLFSSLQTPLVHWWLTDHENISPKRMARHYTDWCFGHWRELESSE